MDLLGYALATLIGLSLGLMGGGGSILTVPIFVYVLGFAAKPAIAMSLPVVGITSLVGAIGHWRAGNVHLRTAAIFGIVAMLGAYLGARLAVFIPGPVQLLTLAVVMLAAAASMLRARPAPVDGAPGSPPDTALPLGKIIAVGIAVGVLTGIVGIGGGFLIVPALVVLGRVPIKQAVGTSLLVIAMNSVSGFLGYAGQVEIPWPFLARFTAFAVAGILAGTYLVRYVSPAALKRGFAMFLLVVGAFMLYQNRGVLTGASGPTSASTSATR